MISFSMVNGWNSQSIEQWNTLRSRGKRRFLITTGIGRMGLLVLMLFNLGFFLNPIAFPFETIESAAEFELIAIITSLLCGLTYANRVWKDTEASYLKFRGKA